MLDTEPLWEKHNFGLVCLLLNFKQAHFTIDLCVIEKHTLRQLAVYDQLLLKKTTQRKRSCLKRKPPQDCAQRLYSRGRTRQKRSRGRVLWRVLLYLGPPSSRRWRLMSLAAAESSGQDARSVGREPLTRAPEIHGERRRRKWAMRQPVSCLWTLRGGCWYGPSTLRVAVFFRSLL